MEIEDDYKRYRRKQEEDVSNESGNKASAFFFAIHPNICSVILTLKMMTPFGSQMNRLFEFCFIIMPCILCCILLSVSVLAISLYFLMVSPRNILMIFASKPEDIFKSCPGASSSKLAFITNFCALMNIMWLPFAFWRCISVASPGNTRRPKCTAAVLWTPVLAFLF